MATNKNAQLRYKILDRCFRNSGKQYFNQDLLDACNKALYEFNGDQSGIQRRQLYDDIRFMESEEGYSIPLDKIKDGKKTYYRYSDLSFSIHNQPLNETEVDQLQSAMMVLSRFEGLPQFEWVRDLIPKLLPGANETHTASMSFDQNQYLTGLEYIGQIFEAISNQQVLDIEYQDFKSDESYIINCHPYFLKQFNNRWFLKGLNTSNEVEDWTIALDRIKSIAIHNSEYIQSNINWDEYFEDIIGVTMPADQKLTKIKIWFAPTTAPYIITKPFHGSQKKVKHNDKGLTIQIEIIPNYEFYQKLLHYSSASKVVTPKSVRDQMIDRLNTAIGYYNV